MKNSTMVDELDDHNYYQIIVNLKNLLMDLIICQQKMKI